MKGAFLQTVDVYQSTSRFNSTCPTQPRIAPRAIADVI
jgi:hypothetical protein